MYISNPDLEFAEKFDWPRHGQGIIIHAINSVFKRNFPNLYPFELIKYGKPEKNTFDFAKDRLYKMADSQGVEISNFYMIGDNPAADIRGANNNNCKSILVKTGVWNSVNPTDGTELENDQNDPATYVVDSVYEAYKLILEKEQLIQRV